MNEAQQDNNTAITPALSPESEAGQQALESSFARARTLPFFDLDIQLIRRDPGAVVSAPAQAAPVAPVAPKVASAEPTREQKALHALESLLGDRKRSQNPVVPFPQTAFQPMTQTAASLAATGLATTRMLTPQTMPSDRTFAPAPNFVSPELERVSIAPARQSTPESIAAVGAGLTQAAQQTVPSLMDELPSLKLQLLQQAVRQREAQFAHYKLPLQHGPAAAASSNRADSTSAAEQADAQPHELPDDLPWGHVTYRLMVM